MNDKQFEVLKWLGVLIILFVVYKLLGEVGLIKTKEDVIADKVVTEDVFTPKYKNELLNALAVKLKKSKLTAADISKYSLSSSTSLYIKNELLKAKSIFNDDEEAVFNVFKNFHTQFEIMVFCEFFKATTKMDLFVFLGSFLNSDEIARVVKTMNAKPKV